jgi:hypothetical protein
MAPSTSELKEQGLTHLADRHEDAFVETFAQKYGGVECRAGCGYEFPVGGDEVAGLECPDCGHDNFEHFATRYLFWEIESE